MNFTQISPIGKSLCATVMEEYLDGTFEASLKIGQARYDYLCTLYSENDESEYKGHTKYFKLKGHSLTLECCKFDDNGVLHVKIVG